MALFSKFDDLRADPQRKIHLIFLAKLPDACQQQVGGGIPGEPDCFFPGAGLVAHL